MLLSVTPWAEMEEPFTESGWELIVAIYRECGRENAQEANKRGDRTKYIVS